MNEWLDVFVNINEWMNGFAYITPYAKLVTTSLVRIERLLNGIERVCILS